MVLLRRISPPLTALRMNSWFAGAVSSPPPHPRAYSGYNASYHYDDTISTPNSLPASKLSYSHAGTPSETFHTPYGSGSPLTETFYSPLPHSGQQDRGHVSSPKWVSRRHDTPISLTTYANPERKHPEYVWNPVDVYIPQEVEQKSLACFNCLKSLEQQYHAANIPPITFIPGDSRLHALVSYGYVSEEALQNEINRGAVVTAINDQGDSPLHYAVKGAYMQGIDILCTAGAPVDALDSSGCSSLMNAVLLMNYSEELMQQLHSYGASLGVITVQRATLIMGVLAEYILTGSPINLVSQLIRKLTFLLQNGVDVNCGCNLGVTAGHLAVISKRKEIVDLLLLHGARLDLPASDGITATQLALLLNQQSIIESCRGATSPCQDSSNTEVASAFPSENRVLTKETNRDMDIMIHSRNRSLAGNDPAHVHPQCLSRSDGCAMSIEPMTKYFCRPQSECVLQHCVCREYVQPVETKLERVRAFSHQLSSSLTHRLVTSVTGQIRIDSSLNQASCWHCQNNMKSRQLIVASHEVGETILPFNSHSLQSCRSIMVTIEEDFSQQAYSKDQHSIGTVEDGGKVKINSTLLSPWQNASSSEWNRKSYRRKSFPGNEFREVSSTKISHTVQDENVEDHPESSTMTTPEEIISKIINNEGIADEVQIQQLEELIEHDLKLMPWKGVIEPTTQELYYWNPENDSSVWYLPSNIHMEEEAFQTTNEAAESKDTRQLEVWSAFFQKIAAKNNEISAPEYSVDRTTAAPCLDGEKAIQKLRKAIKQGKPERVQSIIKEGIVPPLVQCLDSGKKSMNPVHTVCFKGDKRILVSLIESEREKNGQACVVKALNALDSLGNAGIHILSFNSKCEKESIQHCLKVLVANGSQINLKNKPGDTAIHIAVTTANIAALETLIQLGADTEECNDKGQTPAQLLEEMKQNGEITKTLASSISKALTDSKSSSQTSSENASSTRGGGQQGWLQSVATTVSSLLYSQEQSPQRETAPPGLKTPPVQVADGVGRRTKTYNHRSRKVNRRDTVATSKPQGRNSVNFFDPYSLHSHKDDGKQPGMDGARQINLESDSSVTVFDRYVNTFA